MIVDMHFHLEEGPYSAAWLTRTLQAIKATQQLPGEKHSLAWAAAAVDALSARMQEGCFTAGWLERYLAAGRARGVRHFGVVDHLYRFTEFRSYYEKHMVLDDSPLGRMQLEWLDRVCVYSMNDFLKPLQGMAKEHAELSVGLEADYFPGAEDELAELLSPYEDGLDYVIGSIHFIEGWGFDNPEAKHLFTEHNLEELYAKYYEALLQAIRCGLFQFVGHPDNLKVFGFRPDEKKLVGHYEAAAKAMLEADVGTELNTGLAYRYPVKEACPSPAFLQVLARYGVPLTLSSDSHFPDDAGMLLQDGLETVKEAGYTSLCYYKAKERVTFSIK